MSGAMNNVLSIGNHMNDNNTSTPSSSLSTAAAAAAATAATAVTVASSWTRHKYSKDRDGTAIHNKQ